MKREPEENEKAVFVVEIALRSPEAHRAQELLTQLANCTVWNLVAAQMHPPSLKRHGLAAVPRDLTRMKMRNNSNTCYLNSTVFSILWQVSQRVDARVPRAGSHQLPLHSGRSRRGPPARDLAVLRQ